MGVSDLAAFGGELRLSTNGTLKLNGDPVQSETSNRDAT
jgi:hypothetical protein